MLAINKQPNKDPNNLQVGDSVKQIPVRLIEIKNGFPQ